ncbi:cardiolipin synthase [Bacillus sp. B15-48]|nr:cardiolipin synthase [Bacillus sp. B15-48]
MAFWILVILIGITLLLALDFTIGRRLHLAKVNKTYFPVRKSQLGIFTHGPELFEDYFAELRKAKEHIHILFYIVKNDEISHKFLAILKEKAKEGVEVRLLVDWVGCSISRKNIKKLKAHGIEFSYSQVPKFPFLFYNSQIRNHRKITVIDGKIGYAGGYNVGNEYVDQDKKLNPWRDYHLKLTGEGIQDLQKKFLLDWERATKVNLLHNQQYFPSLQQGETRHQFVPSEGKQLEAILDELLSVAERSIFIGTPYFIPSEKVFNRLLSALDRGISITILVPFKADHILVKEASYTYLRKLIKKGASVYQYKKGFYHAKVLVIDDKFCDLGTANFDKRSMFLNFELNCLIFNREFIERVQTILHQDLQDSRPVALRDLNRFNPFRSLKERAAQTVSYFL